MEHNSSFNKQLRKEITARAVVNKKIKMLAIDIDENNKKNMRSLKSIELKKPYEEGDRKIENFGNFLRDLMSELNQKPILEIK